MASSSCSGRRRRRPSAQLEVEITIYSANLKPLNSSGGYYSGCLNTYAVAWVSTNSNAKSQTSMDTYGDQDPIWNETFVIPLMAASVDQSALYIKIIHDSFMQQDSGEDGIIVIGSVLLPLCEVGIGEQAQMKRLEVISSPSGHPRGKLEFKVMVRDRQGTEGYPYHDAPPPPPHDVPPIPPPPPPPPSTFKDYYPRPPYDNLNVLYRQPFHTPATTWYPYNPHFVGVRIRFLCGLVLGMNPGMLERLLGFMVVVLTIFFGFLIMSSCPRTC